MAPPTAPRVIVYVPQLLPIYQPWVRDHVANLERFDGALFGRARVTGGVAIDDIRSAAASDAGRLGPARLLVTGRAPALEAAARAFAPDLVHAHFGTGGTEAMGIARRLGVPLVVSYHGWDARIGAGGARLRPYERLHLARRPRLTREAALVLTTSRFFRDEVVALGFPPERVEPHYMGVDTDFFAAAGPADRRPAGREVAVVGQLLARKGVDLALDAIGRLRDAGVTLTVIGDGPMRAHLEARAQAEALPVTFLGARPRADVRARLAQARVHLYTSTTRAGDLPEPLGLGPLEAQAMGVPSIGTRSGGIPEVIRDDETGFLIDDGDADALADRIRRLIDDDVLHARLSATARAFVRAEFDVRGNNRRLEARYLALLDDLGRRVPA